jgi:hypothetical protein
MANFAKCFLSKNGKSISIKMIVIIKKAVIEYPKIFSVLKKNSFPKIEGKNVIFCLKPEKNSCLN